MAKKFKCVSHVERVNSSEFDVHAKSDITYGITTRLEQVNKVGPNGLIKKETKYVSYDPKNNVEGFKYTDFAIDNLIAIGAVSGLKHCTLTGSIDGSIENMVGVLDSLDSIEVEDK